MNFVNILLWSLTIVFELNTARSSQARDSSASPSFQRELRWLIEKVHPINKTLSAETLQKNRDIQIWKTREAFAAAERAIGKTVGKRSLSRDFLKRVTSVIKEKEDSSIKMPGQVKEDSFQRYIGPAKVVFLLDGSGGIGFKEIESYKLFVKDVYENLKIPPSGLTFGLLECGSRHYTQKHILTRTVQSSNMLNLSLEKLVPVNGSCELGQSLQMINKNIFKALPSDTPKALVVVLAGKSLDDATNAAKELSKKGVRIVAFGAGGHADMRQLISIADSPLYTFKVPMLKYLPSMSSTAVGFIDKVTEPKYLNNEEATLDLPGSSDEVKQASHRDSNDNTDPNDIGEHPHNDNDLLYGLPPILDQLEGHEPDSWISGLQSDSMQLADGSHPSQNFLPSETPLPAGALDVRPTQTQVGAAQSDWNFAGSKVTPTTQREKNHFHDINIIESNAQSTQGNTPSINQRPEKIPPNNSTLAPPVISSQGGVNGNSVTPSSGTSGVSSLAPEPSPNQVVGNQGNEVPGANSTAPATSPSQAGGNPSSGSNGGNSPAPLTSPSEAGGTPSSSTNGANSSASATSPGQVDGVPSSGTSGASSSGPVSTPNQFGVNQGPVQVAQAQLLPIPVLPVQAIPIQAIQSSAGKNQPSVLVVNQPQLSQENNNETDNSKVGSKGENNQNQGVPTSSPMPTGGKQETQSETGKGAPVLPTTRLSNPNPPGSVNNSTPHPGTKIPSPLTTSTSESPAGGENTPSLSKSGKPKNGHSHPLTTSPESKSPEPHKMLSGNLSESIKNKPTSSPAASSSAASGKTTSEKSNGTAAKPTQQPPIVLCQIICGPKCCLATSKPTTKKLTMPTSKTSAPPTKAESTKPTPESAPEVIAGPPIPFRYPHQPGWFPHRPHSVPQEPIPILPKPPPAPLDSSSEAISTSIQLPMYMTLPPVTASPQISSHQGGSHPFSFGHCHDVHPDCDTFVMNGMCDQSIPFKEIFNVLELCMQSCGVCNSFIKHGQDVSWDSSNKGKEPEDIGFPEYSKKFLKRQVRGIQTTQEMRRRQLI